MEGNTKAEPGKPAHLFVFIHGLWGGPNHLQTIERNIKDLIPSCTKDKIVTLKPSCFRFWKTYDGLELNGKKIIREILYEIETLKLNNDLHVKKISIVGYSLGGLLARYIIGLLNEMEFFEFVEPIFFTTFATPHVGIEFFKNNIFEKTANKVGPYLFGKSGRELFIKDRDKLLVEMADPKKKYFQGLKKFQKQILLSNVKNDRTVAFFTSYITEYAPFDEWGNVKIEYLKGLTHSKIGTASVKPKFVDLTSSQCVDNSDGVEVNIQEETSFLRSNKTARLLIICCIALFVLPLWIPFILTSSLFASIYSMIKVRVASYPNINEHWERVKNSVYGTSPVDREDARIGENQRNFRSNLRKQDSFKGDTSNITGNTMESIMYAEEQFTERSGDSKALNKDDDSEGASDLKLDSELSESDLDSQPTETSDQKNPKKILEIDILNNDKNMDNNIPLLKISDYEKFPLFNQKSMLKMNTDKRFIIDSLNTLDWIKIPVYIDAWNSHDGIVARRGPRTNPKGTATIGLWCSILRNHLKETSES